MPPRIREVLHGPQLSHSAHFGSTIIRANFYREELLKHWRCLEQQREYYSEKAISDVEAALVRLLSKVDQLCDRKNCDQLVSRVLQNFDGVTRLSNRPDSKTIH